MLSFHLLFVGERMLGDKEATSVHSLSVHLDAGNDKVCPSGYDPMTEYSTGS